MSAPIKRYDPEVIRGDCHFEMRENKDGDWLKREDVIVLLDETISKSNEYGLQSISAWLESIRKQL